MLVVMMECNFLKIIYDSMIALRIRDLIHLRLEISFLQVPVRMILTIQVS